MAKRKTGRQKKTDSPGVTVFPDGSTDPVLIEGLIELSRRLNDLESDVESRLTTLEIILAGAGIAATVIALIYLLTQ